MMNCHETWVHFWRWKIVIKVWVNMFYLFFSDKVAICVFRELFLFNLRIFYVLFLCINIMSVFMGIVHRIDMVISVFKAGWVQFWLIARSCIPRRSCVGCISVFIEVLWPWSVFVIILKALFMDDFSLRIMFLPRENDLVLYNAALAIISHLFC